MSLNGLDVPAVQDAYQSAIHEAGGWFLLKYVSRDSVELLARGKGGVHEARSAIARYGDASPLYGLIIYRRRKVLITYIPEGTSRLLQARSAVHFQDVAQAFTPYDTLLEFTTADGLNDTSLAASFPLHTASPTASSSKLHEISEDGEDNGPTPRRQANQKTSDSIIGTQRYKLERGVDQLLRSEWPTPSIQITGAPAVSVESPVASPPKTSISQFLVRDDSGKRSITTLESLRTRSGGSVTEYGGSNTGLDASSKDLETIPSTVELPKAHSRLSQASHDAKTALSGSSFSDSLTGLAQLPKSVPPTPDSPARQTVLDEEAGSAERLQTKPTYTPERRDRRRSEQSVERPSVDSRASTSEQPGERPPKPTFYDDDIYDFSRFEPKPKIKLGPRPVAAGERTKRPTVASISTIPAAYRPVPKKQEPVRPQSQGPASTPASLPALPKLPPIPYMPEYNPRPLSGGSIKSLPSHKSTAMTPDKIRLMKAVELRKKQLRKSNPQSQTFNPPADTTVPAVPEVPDQPKREPQRELAKPPVVESILNMEKQTPSKKADSGIEMGYEQSEKREDKVEETKAEEPSLPTTLEASRPTSPHTSGEDIKSAPDEPPRDIQQLQNGSPPTDNPTPDRPTKRLSTSSPSLEKPATVPTKVTREETSYGEQSPLALDDDCRASKQDAGHSANDLNNNSTLSPTSMSPKRQNSDLAKRRRGIVEPLQIDVQKRGDDEPLSDELTEQLRSAMLEEATPMMVSKSLVAPYCARRPSSTSVASGVSNHTGHSARSIGIVRRQSSINLDQFTESPELVSSESANIPPTLSQPVSTLSMENNDPMSALKRNVSSGISKRIQTLAEAASRESSPQIQHLSSNTTPNDFIGYDHRDSRGAQPRSGISSFKMPRRQSGRASTIPSANSMQQSESAPVWSVQHDGSSNRDSVSVKARIVRSSPAVQQDEQAAFASNELHHPKLEISHKRVTPSLSGKRLPFAATETNTSFGASKSELVPTTNTPPPLSPTLNHKSTEASRTLHSANRKSMGRHRQSEAEDFPQPPSTRTISSTSLMSNDEQAAPKEGSRTSRFFKRMSNIGGNKRKSTNQHAIGSMASLVNPSPNLARNSGLVAQDRSEMPPALAVGELNVQFPDTLLWKRRWVEIDEAGYLVLSISQAMDHQRGAAKKCHMTEFKLPCPPDLDRQELPNSIILDFVDGTTLQAACEDTMTHRHVLHILRTYHRAWSSSN